MKLALAVLVAACGGSEPAPTRGSDRVDPRDAPTLLAGASELVTAIPADWNATAVELHHYRRAGKSWKELGPAWPGVIGRTGAAWGNGLHGTGAPKGTDGPVKREGDGKSPAGAFAIGSAYGYAPAAPAGTHLPYQAVDAAWKCVDDPASKAYNRILDQRTTSVDWKSAEDMKRADALYTWVVDVAHNPTRTPSAGSCIFLHVWSGPASSTVGCTAMAEPVLAQLVATLDPSAVFVLLPKREYAALAPAWNLP